MSSGDQSGRRTPSGQNTPAATHSFAGVDPRSAEGHLRSVLWDILGGMGAESVESAAQRVVRERDVARRMLAERPWICDHDECDRIPSALCVAHTIEGQMGQGSPCPYGKSWCVGIAKLCSGCQWKTREGQTSEAPSDASDAKDCDTRKR